MTIEMTDSYLRTDGHDVQEVPDGYVVYQEGRDRVHFLNPTAVVVYELCDGAHDLGRIAAFMASAFDLVEPPIEEIKTCIASLIEEDLVKPAGPLSSGA